MPTDRPEPTADDATLEVRAAVDVMFEALSHIQASLETTSEEKRVESYRRFKEALYERFEYIVEERRQAPEAEEAPAMNGHAAAEPADRPAPNGAVLEGDDDGEDTLEKLWPTIAKNQTS
jgi:hypothetical protein